MKIGFRWQSMFHLIKCSSRVMIYLENFLNFKMFGFLSIGWSYGPTHKVIVRKYGSHQNKWDSNHPIIPSFRTPLKAICESLFFLTLTLFVIGDSSRIRFWIAPCSHSSPFSLGCLILVIILLVLSLTLFVWFCLSESGFHFRCNIRDSELDDLVQLLDCLDSLFFCSIFIECGPLISPTFSLFKSFSNAIFPLLVPPILFMFVWVWEATWGKLSTMDR